MKKTVGVAQLLRKKRSVFFKLTLNQLNQKYFSVINLK